MKTKKTSKSTFIAASAKPAAPISKGKAPVASAPRATLSPVPVAKAAPSQPSAPQVRPAAVTASLTRPPAPAKAPETIISVNVDVGFGNQVYLRGEGPGLSWEKGVPADCAASDLWTLALKDAAKPVRFKVLVNDATWSTGEDYEVIPGQKVTFTPRF